jgi:hypothetical protein
MHKKQFLNEIKSLSTEKYTRPATLTLKIAPADELVGVEATEIVIKSDDRRFLNELRIEAEICTQTGEHPTKLAKFLKENHNYGPPPKKTGKRGAVYTGFTPATLDLSDLPPSTITALQNFQDELTRFVPDISELMSDQFTDTQKYLLRIERTALCWIALGLFHRIFGAIPDVLSDDNCPLHETTFKTHVIDEINLKSAEFQLLTAGEKYIRDFAKKHNRDYPFNRPLDLFMKIFTDGIKKGVDSIMHGDENYEDKKEVNKARAMFKKFIKGSLEQTDRQTVEDHLFTEGWLGLVSLALAPHYASREETHFKKLWDVYLDARDAQASHTAALHKIVIDSTGNLSVVKPHNKRQKMTIYWEDDRLLLGPEL